MRFQGIAVPVLALIAVMATDQLLHSHDRATTRCWRGAPPPRTVNEIRESVAFTCEGPEGLEYCSPRTFAATFAADLPYIKAYRSQLEHRWLEDLEAGGYVAAFGLAYLGSARALPDLRLRLLSERHFYGWESSRPDAPDVLYADEQYPRHLALISAIEHISGQPLSATVSLSRSERRRLLADASDCDSSPAAHWLLHKLDGAPLPTEAAIAAARRRCEQQ
jgi:hypothetical protein